MKQELLKLPLKEKEKLILTELDKKFNLVDSKTVYNRLKREPEIFGLTKSKWLINWLGQTTPAAFSGEDFYSLVIFPLAHPAFLVEEVVFSKLKTFYWKYRLGPKQSMIEKVEQSVGRLEYTGLNKKKSMLGSCFRIAEDLVITTGSNLKLITGTSLQLLVDFSNNRKRRPERAFLVKKIIYSAKESEPDLIILQLEKKNHLQHSIPKGLSFSNQCPIGNVGLVLGYPYKINTVSKRMEHLAIFGSPWNLNRKRIAPGHLSSSAKSELVYSHDCTTETGNEGSPVIDLASGQILGMHCRKTENDQGLAITAKYINDVLEMITQ